MKIDKHGLKIVGLKKASGNTMNNYQAGCYDEIFYDKSTGEVWTKYQCSLGFNSWTEYHDENIIKLCNTTEHLTMQEIADLIEKCVNER